MKRTLISVALMSLCAFGLFAQSWSKDLEKNAKKGDVTSQIAVGDAYYKGDGVDADAQKAGQWFYKAAVAGSDDAKTKLYGFYSKSLEKFAKEGDAQAQYEVGVDYLEGNDVVANAETAGKWFYLAKAQSHKEATEKLYSFYSKSLEKAAKEGDAQAQYEVGVDYLEGNDVVANAETAGKWFYLAKAQIHKEASEKLYSFYSKSLEKAAKEGDAQAQYEVGVDYFEGNDGLAKKVPTAAMWFDLAKSQGHKEATDKFYSFYSKQLENYAKKGEVKAQYYVAEAYLNGIEVKQDLKKATKFFKMGALQGHKESTEKLFSYYNKDLRKLAKTNADAQYALGLVYYNGVGIEKDTETAAEYFAMALDNGHSKARDMLYSFDSYARSKRSVAIALGDGAKWVTSKDSGMPFSVVNSYSNKAIVEGVTTSTLQVQKGSYIQKVSVTNLKVKVNNLDVTITDNSACIYQGNLWLSKSAQFVVTIEGSDIPMIVNAKSGDSYVAHLILKENKLSVEGGFTSKGFTVCDKNSIKIDQFPYPLDSINTAKVFYENLRGSVYCTGRYYELKMNNGDIIKAVGVDYYTAYIYYYKSANGKFFFEVEPSKYDNGYVDVDHLRSHLGQQDFVTIKKVFNDGSELSFKFKDDKDSEFIYPGNRKVKFKGYFHKKFYVSDVMSVKDCEDKDKVEETLAYYICKDDKDAIRLAKKHYESNKFQSFTYNYATLVENGVNTEMTTHWCCSGVVLFSEKQYNTFSTNLEALQKKGKQAEGKKRFDKIANKYGKANANIFWDKDILYFSFNSYKLRKGMSLKMLKDMFDLEFYSSHDNIYSTYTYDSTIMYFKNGSLTHWSQY